MKNIIITAWHCVRILAAAVVVALASCNPRAIVVEPIHPRAVRVAEASAATVRQAAKVNSSIIKASKEAIKLDNEIVKGMIAAEALRKSGLATQEQLDANAESWKKVHARSLFLEAANKSAVIDAKELSEAAERGHEEAEALIPEAKKTDANTAKIIVEKQKLQGDASFGRKIKWGIGTILVMGVIYLLLRFLLPLLKPI